MGTEITIGLLALQGAFREHISHFAKVVQREEYTQFKFSIIEVRTAEQLNSCDALVIPGGESTTISLIAESTKLLKPLQEFVKKKPVWGTCAGLIFLSKQIVNGEPNQQILGGLDIQVKRNAFGRQLDSFVADLEYPLVFGDLKDNKFQTFFIRAPIIEKVLTDADFTNMEKEDGILYSENDYTNKEPVEVLKKLENGSIVAVRQGNKLGTSFHPELSNDIRFHKWFIDEFIIKGRK